MRNSLFDWSELSAFYTEYIFLIYITLFKYVRLFAWKIASPYSSKRKSIRDEGSWLMGTIFNHAFGSTKLNRPQEELNQGVQIAVCNSLATTPSDTDSKRYELIIKCSRQSGVSDVNNF
uniref:Uncharacterized protein n=1 Tax=Caenorhabditis japonica TaxID=281687 RepID=A0A8R1IFW9_CAEJA